MSPPTFGSTVCSGSCDMPKHALSRIVPALSLSLLCGCVYQGKPASGSEMHCILHNLDSSATLRFGMIFLVHQPALSRKTQSRHAIPTPIPSAHPIETRRTPWPLEVSGRCPIKLTRSQRDCRTTIALPSSLAACSHIGARTRPRQLSVASSSWPTN
jgi:hypothetical protein